MEVRTGQRDGDLRALLQDLDAHLASVRESLDQEPLRKDVVFLPWKASCWDAMETVWRAASADPAYHTVVIPVPWYYLKDDGSPEETPQYEGDRFPPEVPVTGYGDYDLAAHHPYMIVIQVPYDQCDYTAMVHSRFWSSKIKAHTDHLVYIPWFTTMEFDFDDPDAQKAVRNMRYYVTAPGVVHSDLTVVQSERMRKTYIEVLTKMSGEEARPVWEEKIRAFGSPIHEKAAGESRIWERIAQAARERDALSAG